MSCSKCNECENSCTCPQAEVGERGFRGLQGEPGTDGIDGIDGTNGTNGADSTVPGPPGTNGTNGIDGTNGFNGTNGTDGIDGDQGIQGATGPQGVPGAGGLTWITNVCSGGGCDLVAQVNHGYVHFNQNAGTQSSIYTLPTGASVGDVVKVLSRNGIVEIACDLTQLVVYGTGNNPTGASFNNTVNLYFGSGEAVQLVYIGAEQWIIDNFMTTEDFFTTPFISRILP
tara:strand:+ start:509 stop:1192 length:684 start_codon:yes stop_codon:yes gene_type:complete